MFVSGPSLRLATRAFVTAALLSSTFGAPTAFAQSAPPKDSSAGALRPVTITATRTTSDVNRVAAAVSVVDSTRIQATLPTSATDALRETAGVDVVGTGPNQGRPAIRGQRGQRILLLEDGLRINNSRRQQDFGELPALVDVDQVARVEVVRGPSSVLYGTDAIGGVVNLISRPLTGADGKTAGFARYQYGSAGTLGKTTVGVSTTNGGWRFGLDASARVAGDYSAPSGSYGNVKLANDTPLQLSGVRDRNLGGAVNWNLSPTSELFGRFEQYVADNAGFGYVPPSLLGGDQTQVQISYPHQEFDKYSLGWRSTALKSEVADRFEVTAYRQRNQRNLAQHVFAPFGPGTPPGAGADINALNFTDITTTGFRAEASKAVSSVVFTYGADLFSDNSVNTDSSLTTIVGFGPPVSQANKRPQVPNATLTSGGVFAQGDVRVTDRISVIVGARGQYVTSAPRVTAGRTDTVATHTNSTGVYAVNGVWRATDDLSVVATVGRGFRSPNLVERYFDGPTPEGSAYQKAAPDLNPETSLNVDGGVKYRAGRFAGEVSLFQNEIHDAIVTAPTGAKQGTLPVYQNVNVDKLRTTGGEAAASVALEMGFSVGANYSSITSRNVSAANSPIGDTFSNKVVATLGWTETGGKCWAEYAVRRNGEQKDIAANASPVGPTLPAFTVHNIRAGIRGIEIGGLHEDLTVAVNNLGNALYAEAADASFFRPEPGRNVTAALTIRF